MGQTYSAEQIAAKKKGRMIMDVVGACSCIAFNTFMNGKPLTDSSNLYIALGYYAGTYGKRLIKPENDSDVGGIGWGIDDLIFGPVGAAAGAYYSGEPLIGSLVTGAAGLGGVIVVGSLNQK